MEVSEKMYNEILRGVCYLFKEYSKKYLENKACAARYYQKNKEVYIQRQKKRYEDPEEKEKIKLRASKWNKLIKA